MKYIHTFSPIDLLTAGFLTGAAVALFVVGAYLLAAAELVVLGWFLLMKLYFWRRALRRYREHQEQLFRNLAAQTQQMPFRPGDFGRVR